MRSITELLLNHKIPGVREAQIRSICAEELSAVLGIPITASQMKVSEGRLSLSVAPIVKSALTLKGNQLKERCQARGVEITEVR